MDERLGKEIDPQQLHFFPSCRQAVAELTLSGVGGATLDLTADQEGIRSAAAQIGRTLPQGQLDVYNPSIPFTSPDGRFIIAGRAEGNNKKDEHNTVIIFFEQRGDHWHPLQQPAFDMQDPNITWIDGQMVLSGVELAPSPIPGEMKYRTVFYVGADFQNLHRLTEGTWGMKGIRLSKLSDGRIGIYTRPQGEKGNEGQIGFTTADSLEHFAQHAETIISDAPLLDWRFPPGEWGGVNQVLPQPDGRNLIIGHRAYKDEAGLRHYYPWAFVHDPISGEIVDLGLLAQRSNFPDSHIKAEDLADIVYTAGIVDSILYTGLSDATAGMIKIANPLDRLPG